MKKIYWLGVILCCSVSCFAQNSRSLKVVLDVNKAITLVTGDASVDITGYDGNSLIVEPILSPVASRIHAGTTGMKEIRTGSTVKEPTGLSYKVISDTGNMLKINIISSYKHLSIRLPNTLRFFSIYANTFLEDSELSLTGIKSPFYINSGSRLITINGVSGPFSIHGYSGKIVLKDIAWNTEAVSPKFIVPYTIQSENSDIDLVIPSSLKEELAFHTVYGQVFTNLNFTNSQSLNSGKAKISVDSRTGNIYIRKKQ
jgi:hypothetical protein